jgi:hypothetical protein
MPRVGFESTIPAFERTKTVHASDRAATVISSFSVDTGIKQPPHEAEVKNAWSHTPTPQYIFVAWCLLHQRDDFYREGCCSMLWALPLLLNRWQTALNITC